MIVAILNPKGGSGKSTLSTNFARAMQLRGHPVLIVDTDTQGTMRDWQAMQDDHSDMPPVIGVDPKRMETDLGRLSMAYDVVVVDGTAKMMQGLGHTVKIADMVLIPVQPSGADLWAVSALAELIRTRQQIFNGLPKTAFVVSRQIQGSKLASEIDAALAEFELPVLKTRLSQRVIYAGALSQGLTVLDLEPEGKAADEVRNLTNEIVDVFGDTYQKALEMRRIRIESKGMFNDAYEHALEGDHREIGESLPKHDEAAHKGSVGDRGARDPYQHLIASGFAPPIQSTDLP